MSGPADTTVLLAYHLGLALRGDTNTSLPALPVYDAEPDWARNPDGSLNEAGPPQAYLVVSAYMDEQQRLGPGLRWQPGGNAGSGKQLEPNLYSFVYVGPRQESAGGSLRAIVQEMYRQIEQIKAAFDAPEARQLRDPATGLAGCIAAGQRITIKYDRQGPYIQYLGNLHIGCYGLVSVIELPAPS